MFNNPFPACAFFVFLFLFLFFKWRLARAHSLGQDQSTVAQTAEKTVTECSLTKLRVSSCPDGFLH